MLVKLDRGIFVFEVAGKTQPHRPLQFKAMSPCTTKDNENNYVQADKGSYPLIPSFIPPLKEFGAWEVAVKTQGNESLYLL